MLLNKKENDKFIYEIIRKEQTMNNSAFFKLSYGLYLITARQGEKINGSIINTVTQITDNPKQISIAMNKDSYTHDMIMQTKKAVVTVLATTTPFDTFKRFGFQSGKDVDKFKDITYFSTEDGIPYLSADSCAYLACRVTETVDMGTHTLFLAEVTEAEVLSDSQEPMTYAYYHANVKPQPKPEESKITGYRCIVCGYIYEGEEIPPDFICPWCKHGVIDFEKITA